MVTFSSLSYDTNQPYRSDSWGAWLLPPSKRCTTIPLSPGGKFKSPISSCSFHQLRFLWIVSGTEPFLFTAISSPLQFPRWKPGPRENNSCTVQFNGARIWGRALKGRKDDRVIIVQILPSSAKAGLKRGVGGALLFSACRSWSQRCLCCFLSHQH